MPWCPECGKEFKGGVDSCKNCQVELVDHPADIEDETFKKVAEVSQQEGEILESLLKSHDITVLKNYRGAGGYLYMGRSSYGVDLFVPASQLETAREILEAAPTDFE